MGEKEVKIRAYKPGDYQDVRQNLEEGEIFYEEMDSEDRLRRKIEISPDSILVAEVGGQVVGNVILSNEWGPLIFRLAVREENRERGIGSQLMNKAEESLEADGFREAHLLVGESEDELKGWYKKRGYSEGGLYRWMYKELEED